MKNEAEFEKILDTDYSIAYCIDDSYTMDKLHFHNVYEIYFAQTGGLRFFVNNKIYPIEKNDLFVFNHLDLHRIGITPGTHYERYVIIFNPDYIKNYCTDTTDLFKCFTNRNQNFSHRIHLNDKQTEEFLALYKKAETYFKSSDYGDDVYKKMTLAEILIFINHFNAKNEFIQKSDSEFAKIKPLINYINENIHLKLSLEHLASRLYISRFYLCKIFKEATGFTVKEYIIYRRIMKATELLRENIPVSQVSEMTGFQNDCHFITTFKKNVGISPKQYSKREMKL